MEGCSRMDQIKKREYKERSMIVREMAEQCQLRVDEWDAIVSEC